MIEEQKTIMNLAKVGDKLICASKQAFLNENNNSYVILLLFLPIGL